MDDGSFRDIRNTALITWFIMVGRRHGQHEAAPPLPSVRLSSLSSSPSGRLEPHAGLPEHAGLPRVDGLGRGPQPPAERGAGLGVGVHVGAQRELQSPGGGRPALPGPRTGSQEEVGGEWTAALGRRQRPVRR